MSDVLFKMARPWRAFMKRWGSTAQKQAAWHAEFTRGLHVTRLEKLGRSSVCDIVERYANGGDILDFGCCDGHVGLGLEDARYRSYTGIDISEVGVREATAKCQAVGGNRPAKNKFEVGDAAKYSPCGEFDVILFKDSLYYVSRPEVIPVLERLRNALRTGGVFIVQMDNIKRHIWIRDLVKKHFTMLEDDVVPEKDMLRFVFR